MVKLMNIISEIKLISSKNLLVKKSYDDDVLGVASKSYKVDMGNGSEFTIHLHTNHATLYPSFLQSSPKYQKIKDFLTKKGIPFEEFKNNNGVANKKLIANLRIPKTKINIISEINLLPKITPDIIIKKYLKLTDPNNEDGYSRPEINHKILAKYGYYKKLLNSRQDIYASDEKIMLLFLKTLPQSSLISIYNELNAL